MTFLQLGFACYFWLLKVQDKPEFGGKPSYGGYDCNNWTSRDMSSHKHEAIKYKDAHTNAERVAICRKSIL